MVTLTHDAQGHLERYLRQLKAALRGHPSVDVGEIERDVLGHIDAELAGQPEPVGAGSLREVLNRLGAPDQWVPLEEQPAWRKLIERLRSGPEDWRLAYLTFGCFMVGPGLFLGGPFLWPLPPLLIVASFIFARTSLAVLAEHDEPVGARRWLIYPPLVLWYTALVIALIGWPLPPAVLGATDTPIFSEPLARTIPGPSWFGATAAIVLTMGLWWVILGILLRRFTAVVRNAFWPFADWFDRRHAMRLVVAGAILMIVSGGTIAAAIMWRSAPSASAQTLTPPPAVPLEPIAAILDAFQSHQIVALGEGTHDNEQGHAFRLALVRHPRFPSVVNDIVVESGNARYQDLMDRFVHGDDVPYESLRRVWQNTTQPDALWDTPIYEEFFRAVRAVNTSVPMSRHLRVLLGDPPIDWDTVRSAKDYGTWDRDGHPAEIIRREVLGRGRRALVIYGDLHFIRKNIRPVNAEDDSAKSIVGLLEKTGARVFSIRTIAYGIDLDKLQPDVLSWPRPSLAMLRGTVLGTASFSSYYPRPLVVGTDGKPGETPDDRRPLRMEEQFDALLYLGPQSTITRARLSPALCADAAYVEMRIARMTLMGLQPGIERFKQQCRTLEP